MAQQTKPKRPQFVNGIRVKMPQDYDFNTWGKDYSQYRKDFRLRTDAVWQKTQLKDWFRIYHRIFFFNRKAKKYMISQPDDLYSHVLQSWAFEDDQVFDYDGYTQTGRSNNFQIGLGPKERVENTFNSFYSMPDYYIMCAMRFQKWFKCDSVYYQDRETDYDRNPDRGMRNMKVHQAYPCYKDWYQASYSCNDQILKYLIQLAYAKRSHDFFAEDTSSVQIRSFPTVYDSPKQPERVSYTY